MSEERSFRGPLLIAAIPIVLALAFATIRPAWLASSAPSHEDSHTPVASSGVSFSLGASGPVVEVKHPTHGRIAEVIHAPATIKPGSEVEVGAPFEGKVAELVVDEGAVVSANDVIFRLDPVEYADKKHEAELELARKKAAQAESDAELTESDHKLGQAKIEPSTVTEARLKIRQSELSRDRSQAQLENAEAKLARARDMLKQGVGKQDDVDAADSERRVDGIALHIADEELRLARESLAFRERDAAENLVSCQKAFDTSQTHVARAKADLVAAQVALDRAARDLEKCAVRTPIAGVVTQRNVNEGSLVIRGDGGTVGNTTQVTPYIVSDMAHMLAYADVEEGDVAKVHEDQTTWVRVNALGDDVRLQGKVYDIANRAQQKANEDTKSFRVRIQITEKDSRLRPDMSANVDVETRVTADDAVRVPLQAVLQRAKKDVEGAVRPAEAPPAQGPGQRKARTAAADSASGALLRSEDRLDVVFVLGADGKVQPRIITLGPSDGEFVQAIAGIETADWIVTGPYKTLDGLKAGDTVIANYKDSTETSAVAATSSSSTAKKP